MHGEPGVGKTALLEYAIESAAGLRMARVAGVESEMELAFAALQQLCAPMLDRLEGLPDPQRAALGVAFGLRRGRRRTGFWWGWPRSACCRRWLSSSRCCAWSMTRSGWTGPQRRR